MPLPTSLPVWHVRVPLEFAIWVPAICVLIFVPLELVAFGCGIAARRTVTGKAGILISALLLALLVIAVFYMLAQPMRGSGRGFDMKVTLLRRRLYQAGVRPAMVLNEAVPE